MTELHAISDLHVGHPANRSLVVSLPERNDDILVVGGDVGDTFQQVTWALSTLREKYGVVIWTPGNHELWTLPDDACTARGAHRYELLVEWCRDADVRTPEDPYVEWETDRETFVVAPIFTLYDYSFRPSRLSAEAAIAAATRLGSSCLDERFLFPDPYPSREAWCEERVSLTALRLDGISPAYRTVLVGHFPLRYDLVHVPTLPLFSLWCGTVRTESWHTRFRAGAVVNGHLHRNGTQWRDGVPFIDVSLGYPRERRGGVAVLHEVVPDEEPRRIRIGAACA